MKTGCLYRVVCVLLLCQGLCSSAWASVFFSEYVEGSGSNKALEIFNHSGASISLSSYSVQLFFNGNSTSNTTINLPEQMLLAGEVFVLAHSSADTDLTVKADLLIGNLQFNGDDVVGLAFNNQLVDVIGQIGVDPGTQWVGGGIGTLNQTLRRKLSVLTGDSVGSDAFDPSVQWEGFPFNTFGGLGEHTAIPEPITSAIVAVGVFLTVGLRSRGHSRRN